MLTALIRIRVSGSANRRKLLHEVNLSFQGWLYFLCILIAACCYLDQNFVEAAEVVMKMIVLVCISCGELCVLMTN